MPYVHVAVPTIDHGTKQAISTASSSGRIDQLLSYMRQLHLCEILL